MEKSGSPLHPSHSPLQRQRTEDEAVYSWEGLGRGIPCSIELESASRCVCDRAASPILNALAIGGIRTVLINSQRVSDLLFGGLTCRGFISRQSSHARQHGIRAAIAKDSAGC